MIQGILNVLFNVCNWFIGLFPTITIFSDISESVAGIYSYLYAVSAIVPVSDFFICIGIISGFYVSLFLIKLSNWILHRIPILN